MTPSHLVLLPGLDGTGLLFEPFVAAAPEAWSTTVVRYPASLPTSYAHLERYVRDRLPAGGSYLLLGESFSGPLALRIAAHRPRGLRGVVLAASFATGPSPLGPLAVPSSVLRWLPLRSALARVVLMGGARDRALSRQLERAIASVPAAVLAERLREVLKADERETLRRVEVAVLSLLASRDWLVPSSRAREIEAASPRAEAVSVAGPHLLLQRNPAACWDAIAGFAERRGA